MFEAKQSPMRAICSLSTSLLHHLLGLTCVGTASYPGPGVTWEILVWSVEAWDVAQHLEPEDRAWSLFVCCLSSNL